MKFQIIIIIIIDIDISSVTKELDLFQKRKY